MVPIQHNFLILSLLEAISLLCRNTTQSNCQKIWVHVCVSLCVWQSVCVHVCVGMGVIRCVHSPHMFVQLWCLSNIPLGMWNVYRRGWVPFFRILITDKTWLPFPGSHVEVESARFKTKKANKQAKTDYLFPLIALLPSRP